MTSLRYKIRKRISTVLSVLQLLLLHYKANTDAQDNNGNTPLHLACMYGHEDVSSTMTSEEF